MEDFRSEFGECTFCWSGWKGPLRRFVESVRECHTADETSDRGDENVAVVADDDCNNVLNKVRSNSWKLPVVVTVTRGFDSGCDQRTLMTGEVLLVKSMQVQKRVKLLTQTDEVVTLPHDTNLRFSKITDCKESPTSESLGSLIDKRSNNNRKLCLRLTESIGTDKDASYQMLKGILTYLKCYKEYFLYCIPIKDDRGQGCTNTDILVIPAYYPVTFATASAYLDSKGHDRLEKFFNSFSSTLVKEVSVSSSRFEELTLSQPFTEYELIEAEVSSAAQLEDKKKLKEKSNHNSFNSEMKSGPNKKGSSEEKILKKPILGQGVASRRPLPRVPGPSSNNTATSRDVEFSADGIDHEVSYGTLSQYGRVKPKKQIGHYPRTPTGRKTDQAVRGFGKSNLISTDQYETETTEFDDTSRADSTCQGVEESHSGGLVTTKSMIDIYSIGRNKVKLSKHEKSCAVSPIRKQELEISFEKFSNRFENRDNGNKIDGKFSKINALSQIFNFVKKKKENVRKNKSLSFSNQELLGNYSTGTWKVEELKTSILDTCTSLQSMPYFFSEDYMPRSSNHPTDEDHQEFHEYDTIDSPTKDKFPNVCNKTSKASRTEEPSSSDGRLHSLSLDALDYIRSDDSSRNDSFYNDRVIKAEASTAIKGRVGRCAPITINSKKEISTFPRKEKVKTKETYLTPLQTLSPSRASPLGVHPKEENEDDRYEEIVTPKVKEGETFRIVTEGGNYLEMGQHVYISSNRESVKSVLSMTRWTSFDQVPSDPRGMLISEVSMCLELLNLGKHVEKFAKMQIDGALLCSLNEEILQNDLKLNGLDTLKLMKFVRDGWRPK